MLKEHQNLETIVFICIFEQKVLIILIEKLQVNIKYNYSHSNEKPWALIKTIYDLKKKKKDLGWVN